MSTKKKSNVITPNFKTKKISNQLKGAYPQQMDSVIPKQYWESFNDLYQQIAGSLINVSENIAKYVRMLQGVGPEKEEAIKQLVKTSFNDVTTFSKALVVIKSRHADRKGTIESDDDNALSIQIMMDYEDVVTRFSALSFQTVQILLDYLNEYETEIKAKEQTIDVAKTLTEDKVEENDITINS